ncbi:LIM homeobox transcription factor 1-beta-like isoform X2 [Rhopilema esculentum]|uniref:LIM homeobox transcription factor 1-beta-like isoform X2 n=1 Tax=Rhopilema esculentum TaxID=499914 RepID=UPI0031D665CC
MDLKIEVKKSTQSEGSFHESEMKSHQARLCTSCDQPIDDRFLFCVNDVYWHESCLECCVCRCPLTDSCYSKENKLFCRGDYRRLFGAKCSTCKQDIAANELVMRAMHNVYHLHCFKCYECGQSLEKGDEFGLKDDRLFCREDLNGIRPEKDVISDSTHAASDKSEASPVSSDISCETKSPKRPRTILTSAQRKAFKASFEMTPKPCRKVREELSRDTGLSVRVVQVWFQNQRAKLKKIAKKNNPNQMDDSPSKRSAKSKKKVKTRSRSGLECDDKKRSCRRDCSSISDTPPHTPLTTPFSNHLQPFDNMIPMHESFPHIPPPNLEPFYPTPPSNSGQSNNYSCLSPSDLPPPPYSMAQNFQHGDGMMMENGRISGMLNYGHDMTSPFMDHSGHGRHMQMLNHALNSY